MNNPTMSISRRNFLKTGASCTIATLAPLPAFGSTIDATVVAQTINNIELTESMLAIANVELRRKGAKNRVRSLELAQIRQGSSQLSMRKFSFLSPADIEGTKLLVHESESDANNLWLLLPSIGKPRRISASKQSNSFSGTDFSYADMMALKVENFSHEITSSDAETVILDSKTKTTDYAKQIGYERSVVKATAGSFVPLQIDYYDRKQRLFKTQILSDVIESPNGSFVIKTRHMIVHDEGRETIIKLDEVSFTSGLGTSDFKSRRL